MRGVSVTAQAAVGSQGEPPRKSKASWMLERNLMRVKLTAAASALLFSVLAVQAPVGAQGQAVPVELDAVADALGMLRGMGRDDVILTVEFSGAGTMSVVGEGAEPGGPWPQHKVTRYDVSIAYDMAGMRVNLERVGPDGASQEEILAVSGRHAWNESEPGAGLVAGEGTATPAMDAWVDRSLAFWMLPQGFVKAATMADSGTEVVQDGGMTMMTTVVPEMPGTTMTAHVNADNFIDRVETTVEYPGIGEVDVEASYSNYYDLGGEENPSDVLYPGRIVRTVDGHAVLDLTVTGGNSYNPYVIVPVPDSVEGATE